MQKLLTFENTWKKMWVAFAKATHIFSKNIGVYAIFIDQSFNDTLTNDIMNFEQLSPEQEPFRSSFIPPPQQIDMFGNTWGTFWWQSWN